MAVSRRDALAVDLIAKGFKLWPGDEGASLRTVILDDSGVSSVTDLGNLSKEEWVSLTIMVHWTNHPARLHSRCFVSWHS